MFRFILVLALCYVVDWLQLTVLLILRLLLRLILFKLLCTCYLTVCVGLCVLRCLLLILVRLLCWGFVELPGWGGVLGFALMLWFLVYSLAVFARLLAVSVSFG